VFGANQGVYGASKAALNRITVAFAAELAISFGLMSAVLAFTNVPSRNRFTPFVAATLVAVYITLEAPLSGTSMNPARSFASAVPAHFWHALWIYFLAPPLGMLAAAECHLRRGGAVLCAKLHHVNDRRCIFRCAFPR